MERKNEMRRLAEFIDGLTWEQLPREVQETAAFRVLDLVSAGIGASKDPLIEEMVKAFAEMAGGEGQTTDDRRFCELWGRKERLPIQTAAMINAMLAHTLELDDVHPASKTHGSASLIPAAWSCARYLGSSGKDFLTAVVCGYETVSRIGMALGVSAHRGRGWHATATCGVFGSAAACGKLLRLSTDQLVSALGMAGTQSFGVWAFLGDGSSCKILHTGRAAVSGLDAAVLARCGMTGPEHILEAEDGGLLKAMSDGGDITKVSEGLGTVYEILNMDMKPYPCCRSTHGAIDCVLELRKRMQAEEADHIRQIQVETYDVGYRQCAVSDGCLHPKNAQDARFSLPYCTAVAWCRGKVTMDEFRLELLDDPQLRKLMGLTKVIATEKFSARYPAHWGTLVRIVMEDGTVYEAETADPSGSRARPLSRAQAVDKARALLAMGCPGHEERLIEGLLELENAERLPFAGC